MAVKTKVLINFFLFITLIFCLLIGVSYFVIQKTETHDKYIELLNLTNRIDSDLKYKDGMWDTEMYLSDPLTPNPHGSSGLSTSLYVVTTEGFVIERNLPINGLLDSSDFKHLTAFTIPQFVQGATNERWRVLSKYIKENGRNVGIIFVSLYNPTDTDLVETDKILQSNIVNIESKIIVHDGVIDVSKIDIRSVSYNVSFEVVSVFNKVLLNNGRTPSFIDPSYVYDELTSNARVVMDSQTKIPYYVFNHVITDASGKVKGLITAATSIRDLNITLRNYLVYMFIFYLLVIIPLGFFSLKFFSEAMKPYVKKTLEDDSVYPLPKKIIFSKKESCIEIDGVKFDIPYASNQYYICGAVFVRPEKRWETDELLDKMGEGRIDQNVRKIYDAVLSINKKLGLKLVVHKNKTYYLNSDYLQIVSHT